MDDIYISSFNEGNWTTRRQGHKMYRYDRKEKIGGGAAIQVNDSIVSRERDDVVTQMT